MFGEGGVQGEGSRIDVVLFEVIGKKMERKEKNTKYQILNSIKLDYEKDIMILDAAHSIKYLFRTWAVGGFYHFKI